MIASVEQKKTNAVRQKVTTAMTRNVVMENFTEKQHKRNAAQRSIKILQSTHAVMESCITRLNLMSVAEKWEKK